MHRTVIVARTRAEAAESAFNLGIPADAWYYPRRVEQSHGVIVDRLVYVEGWRGSTDLPADAMRAAVLRAWLHDAEEIETPTTAGILWGTHEAADAAARLALKRMMIRSTDAPFVDPDEARAVFETQQAIAAARPRRPLLARIFRRG